jgi:hypothetical protein
MLSGRRERAILQDAVPVPFDRVCGVDHRSEPAVGGPVYHFSGMPVADSVAS